MNNMIAPRILGVFAHPDDECFCAGGTFAKYAAAGSTIKVISATPGDAGQIRNAAIATRRTLGQVRAKELTAACAQIGVQDTACWEYGDGTLASLDQTLLVRDVVRAIREFRPDVIITFGPDGGYGHPDHIAISYATTDACHRSGDAAEFPEQIEGDLRVFAPPHLYHAYFPQSYTLFSDKLVGWLMTFDDYYQGTADFMLALTLLSEETTMLSFTNDHIAVEWFPPGFYIIEQGEPATKLYMMLSGKADVFQENDDGNLNKVNEVHPGRFFGEEGIAKKQPRNAHVVASESTTCLVFSPEAPTKFAGRGEDAQFVGNRSADNQPGARDANKATVCIDVRDFTRPKIEAISKHRSQFPIRPDMFPLEMMQDLFGQEYFVRVIPQVVWEDTLI
jgi:LmbE family N-acetylglucosaminyl deacetylase